MRSIKETIEREQNPPKIDLKDGWSPYAIKDCLEECGLRSDTYDLFFLEEWRAKAHFKFEGIGVLRNTIDFSVNGTKEMATQLVLKFSCWDPENLKADYEDFIFDCHILFTCAFGTSMPKALDEKLQCRSNFQDEHQGKDIKVVFDDFPDHPLPLTNQVACFEGGGNLIQNCWVVNGCRGRKTDPVNNLLHRSAQHLA